MKPHVLITETTDTDYVQQMQGLGWGRMYCDKPIKPFPFEKWGLDNRGFVTWQNAGFPPDLTIDDWCILWNADSYRKRLEEATSVAYDPYIMVAPDIPGSKHSLEWSLEWTTELPKDWPWYLAVQDGMEVSDVEAAIHLFSGLFLGGTDDFKLTAYRWARLSHKYQKKFHYAR